MKKLIFIIAFFIVCATAKAQVNKDTLGMNLPVIDGQVNYNGVVEVAGKTKAELYANAREWFIDYFNPQKDVIQSTDKDAGSVFGQGVFYFSTGFGLGQYVNLASHVIIQIECKDNKYRYSIYGMFFYNYDSGNSNFAAEQVLGAILGTQKWPWSKNAAKTTLINNDQFMKNAISSLKNAMGRTTTDF